MFPSLNEGRTRKDYSRRGALDVVLGNVDIWLRPSDAIFIVMRHIRVTRQLRQISRTAFYRRMQRIFPKMDEDEKQGNIFFCHSWRYSALLLFMISQCMFKVTVYRSILCYTVIIFPFARDNNITYFHDSTRFKILPNSKMTSRDVLLILYQRHH